MPKVINNENHDICKECGGKCCKHMGGFLHPNDIEVFDESHIREMLDSGRYSIDWVEPYGDIPIIDDVYFLRFRHVGASIVDPSFGGRCVMLTDEGCSLPFEERAYGCKVLTPHSEHKCDDAYYKKQVAEDWDKPEYQELLSKLRNEYDEPIDQKINQLLSLLGIDIADN